LIKGLGPVMLVVGLGCGIEGPLINAGTKDRSTLLPDAADNVVTGTVEHAPDGTAVKAFLATGEALEGIIGSVQDGSFSIRFPGNTGYSGVYLDARWTSGQALAIVPNLPRQVSVLDPERVIALGQDAPGMSPLSAKSTAFTLALWGKALSENKAPSSLSPGVIRESSAMLAGQHQAGNTAVTDFVDLVGSLLDGVGDLAGFPFPGAPGTGAGVVDLVDSEFVSGIDGVTVESFEESLLMATGEVDVESCLAADKIRVVFLVDMRAGARDGNCNDADPFKWASDTPDKTMYFNGGVHETTPVCNNKGEESACLADATVDAANKTLGNWVPNTIQMYDDGTRGDVVKGDAIYTLSLELPFFSTGSLVSGGRGVRLGYKYSWGQPGDGWTETEEWPGNQRLLELTDLNGDGIVTRMDVFGDEASNKDKANGLSPANGGCGVNFWEDDMKQGCGHDTRENMVDTDGDCIPDSWPQPGSASPVTVDCQA